MPVFSSPQVVDSGTVLTDTLRISTGAYIPVGSVEKLLTLRGEVRVTAKDAVGAEPVAVGIECPVGLRHLIWIDGGVVDVSLTGQGTAYGYRSVAFDSPNFWSSGAIHVRSSDNAVGVQFWATNSYWTNTGDIIVAGRLATGLLARAPHTDGLNNGLIQVTATERAIGVDLTSHAAAINNNGRIIVSDTTPFTDDGNYSNDSVALRLHVDNIYKGYGEFHNRGLIEGEIAVQFDIYTNAGADFVAWRTFFNEGTGVLRGMVVGSRATDTIVNTGLIEGEVRLGAGMDTYSTEVLSNGMYGRVTGMVSGGEGDDVLYGGPAFDYLHGNQGDDRLKGGGGDDWLVGGQGNDRIDGEDAADVIMGNLGNDTVDGGGGVDWIRGGQGSDSLSAGGGADLIWGDRGDDTIAGGAGADVFSIFGEAGIDRILDFSHADGDRLKVEAGYTYTTAQVGADVVVTVSGGAQAVLVGVQLSALPQGWII